MEGFEVLYVLLELLYGQILANAIAILMVVLCWRWKAAGRLSFVLLFLWAGQYNLREAFLRAEQYLEYARLASFRSISGIHHGVLRSAYGSYRGYHWCGPAHRGRSLVIAWLCRLSGVGGRHHLSHRCRTPGISYSISINTNHCMRRGIQAR